jgi:hypothetical protein
MDSAQLLSDQDILQQARHSMVGDTPFLSVTRLGCRRQYLNDQTRTGRYNMA